MDKIAIINSVYEYSSTGALTKQLYEYGISRGYEAFVFYGRGESVQDNHVIKIDLQIEVYLHKILTLVTGYQGYFSNIATSKLLTALKKEKIKKVILLNIHGYYLNEKRLLDFLKKNKIQTAYVTPDEYAGLGKCCFSMECESYKTECCNCPHIKDYPKSLIFDRSRAIFNRKKNVYDGFDSMVLIGPETNLVKFRESALVNNKPMIRASWGIDLNKYKFGYNDDIYKKYNIPHNKIIILTVAKYTDPRKGVKEYFFKIAKLLENTEYHFINVGYDGDLTAEKLPKNMTTINYLSDQEELAQIYSLSDLYLLASTTDTMPLSCLISFACETPVCCFYTSGLRYLAPKDSLAIDYCETISINALQKKVMNHKKKSADVMKACRALAKKEYSIDSFNKKVFDVFERQ